MTKIKKGTEVVSATSAPENKDCFSQTQKHYSPEAESQLVDAKQLLAELFSEDSRPSLRWLRMLAEAGQVPHVRLGRLIFFRRNAVQAALARLERATSSPCDALVKVVGLEAGAAAGRIQ